MASEIVVDPLSPAVPRRSRRFGVSDIMITILVVALVLTWGSIPFVNLAEQGFCFCRTLLTCYGPFYASRPEIWRQDVRSYGSTALWYGFQASEVLILSLTPAFLLFRLKRPRPAVRALIRQPGTVAGLAIVFGLVWVTGWIHRLFFGRIHNVTATAIAVGGTVAVAWAVLAASRRWQAEASWVNVLGRRLGAAAIATGLLQFAVFGL